MEKRITLVQDQVRISGQTYISKIIRVYFILIHTAVRYDLKIACNIKEGFPVSPGDCISMAELARGLLFGRRVIPFWLQVNGSLTAELGGRLHFGL